MTRPLRVLRVIARLNIGGPARHVTILDAGLRHAGFETHLVYGRTGDGEGTLEDLVQNLPHTRVPTLGRRVHLTDDVAAFVRIVRLMFALQPDVVHSHTAKAGALARIAALLFNLTRGRRSRALVVHTFHGHVLHGYFGPVGSGLVRWTERTLASITDYIIAISERQRADLTERFEVCARDRVRVIPLGLELDELFALGPTAPSLREDLELSCDAPVIGFVGRLVPIKDLTLLLSAFALVVQQVPAATLVIAGDGPLLGRLKQEAEAFGIADRVRFPGWCRDLARLYATFDVVALTSVNEGTPVMVIEAMAAARSVVAVDTGGVADVVRDGETGVLVGDRTPEAVSRALLELLRSPSARAALGNAGRETAAARYGSTRLVTDVAALYAEGMVRRRGQLS